MALEQDLAVADAFDLASVTNHNRAIAIRSLSGHVKAVSIIWMKTLGLPLLDGMIVRRWSRHTSRIVARFCRPHGFSELLLRIDKKDQRWTQGRGGFLVHLEALPRIVRELAEEDFISILLEPASPYADLYSFGAILDPTIGSLAIEVVGPGFDASDILRSDIQPHERFEATWPSSLRNSTIKFNRVHLTDAENYSSSVTKRLIKISKRIRAPYSLHKPSSLSQVAPLGARAAAVAFLEKRGQPLLLRHLNRYEPVPAKYLQIFAGGVLELARGLEKQGIRLGPTSISASFISEGRIVYWDFFPANPQEFRLIYEA